ncbi:diguanylate cyclase [Desulfuromonas sp. KJ2020]|uniref:diguanylate cyclase n=1 Tax=Desulfuromonas sp. KJ2020 TaxID=2919173 RepID=UPI0020A765DF|nr:diguanylate cyclase [Desulfuromonas sp. KJ2020]MCP3178358.1 diguanylate cyclase [Desulfuromonas sp. KJ2020]
MHKPGFLHAKVTESAITSFFIYLLLVMVGFISAVYLGIFLTNKQTIEDGLLTQGRWISESIIFARNWNSRYGGVYVEKGPGVESNPYLANPDFQAVDGTIYTKKNPALMVREISEMVAKEGTFDFRITSLNPVNPGNVPDSLERAALAGFEYGEKEFFARERQGEEIYFRYIAPLVFESSCLECHSSGYEVGDVRGGISVRFNIGEVERALQRNLYFIVGLAILSFISLLGIIYRLVYGLRARLVEAEDRLHRLAVTDELTGLKNRRYLLERLRIELKNGLRYHKPLACIMFDLDHFKRVNDSYGHEIGDRVLKTVADVAELCRRESDTLSRFGGEEFMILLPETDASGAEVVAERLRKQIADNPIPLQDGRTLQITASFGVADLRRVEEGLSEAEKDLLLRVDHALYQAKAHGRNCVITQKGKA